jgi:hypothetical protein
MALVAASAVVTAVSTLRPFADSNGPGTRGERPPGFSGDAATNITSRMDVEPADLPRRAGVMLREHLPEIFGLRLVDSPIARQGHGWIFWPFMAGLCVAVGRSVWLNGLRPDRSAAVEVAWYFALVGAAAVAVYTLSKPPGVLVTRYLLLSVFLPIGLVALHLSSDAARFWRAITAGMVLVWVLGSAWDHALQVRRYAVVGEPNETRDLANVLEARGITVAEGGYWMAYKLSFLSQERIKVASGDVVRITEYQRLASEAGSTLRRIQDDACEGGERIALWFLCPANP